MRTYFLLVAVCASTVFFSACRSRQQTNNQNQDPAEHATAVETGTTMPANIAITSRLTELGLTPNSDWRGINLGDEFGRVKATEKGESFEHDAEHVGYTVELKNIQTMDILYYQTGRKVSAIDVDLFLNSRQAVTDYQTDLTSYFTSRYGKPAQSNGTLWTGEKGTTVSLKDVSKGKDYGLKIRIGQGVAL